jgi:hexosaminidase
MALFPSQYIHIGGDECPKSKWKTCQFCQKRIKVNKLKNEHELQSYFIQRIEKFVNSKGRKIIGWDEILEGGLAPNATVMSWTGIEGGIAAAKQNHDAIMTPGNFVYFDHVQGRSDQEPLSIGGNTTLEEVYSYNPTPTSLTSAQQARIIGVQANVWTEYMKTPAKVEYMVLPRVLALSEIAWTALDRKNYKNFSEERVPVHLAKFDNTNTVFRVPTAIGVSDTTYLGSKFSIPLKSTVLGAKIYYTLDGYNPRETDILYEKPVDITVPINEKRTLKTMVISPSGKRSSYTTTDFVNSNPLQPLSIMPLSGGLKYFLIPGSFKTTAAFDTLKADNMGITPAINLVRFKNKPRAYGMIFEGYLNVLQDGVHVFSTTSDDGSQLLIDDNLIVDNDGKHATFQLTSSVHLLKGFHKIRINYFQAGGSGELRVHMAEPGQTKHELPAEILFH